MSHFFISYSHSDEKFVEGLKKLLAAEKLLPWTDAQLTPGGRWDELIDLAIDQSLGMVLVVSKHSMESEYVLYEWAHAIGAGKTIIPLCIDETRPNHPRPLNDDRKPHPKLERLQWIIVQDKLTEWQKELIEELRNLAGIIVKFPPVIQKAMELLNEPQRAVRDIGLMALSDLQSPYILDALAVACSHAYPDVSLESAKLLARKSDFKDRRCVEYILQHVNNRFGVSGEISWEHLEIISTMKLEEFTEVLLELIQHRINQEYSSDDYRPEYVEKVYSTLQQILSSETLDHLQEMYLSWSGEIHHQWVVELHDLLEEHDRISS